jgi:hypothetical protein
MAKTNAKHEILFGSDVDRDGVYLELRRLDADAPQFVLEIFRSDRDGSITVTSEAAPMPADVVSELLDRVKVELLQRPLEDDSRA